jgi:hypothetical protein
MARKAGSNCTEHGPVMDIRRVVSARLERVVPGVGFGDRERNVIADTRNQDFLVGQRGCVSG